MNNKNDGTKGFMVIYLPSAVLDPNNKNKECIEWKNICIKTAEEFNTLNNLSSCIVPECAKLEILNKPEGRGGMLCISMPSEILDPNTENQNFKNIQEWAKKLGRDYAEDKIKACIVPDYVKLEIL